MTSARTATRAAAVLGATAALTVAGAGAATAATTSTSTASGDSVSVTFNWTPSGPLDPGDVCGAALVEPQAAVELAGAFASGDLRSIFASLANSDGVEVLYADGIVIDSPVATLNGLTPSVTVRASDVPAGAYTLVSVCASDPTEPSIKGVIVGNPIEVIAGSLGGFSSGAVEDGPGGGIDIATLSSALGGGDTDGGIDLGTLSSQAEAGTEN